MATWYSAEDSTAEERVVGAWPDAPNTNLETLQMILEVAQEQVIAYGTERADDEDGEPLPLPSPIPTRWVYAQLQQAKNLWNAGRVNSSGDVGMDSYTFTPRPLDKTIRGIIRPQEVPNVI